MNHNEIWREESEEHPIVVSYRTGEGVVIRIEDRRIELDTWSKFVNRVERTNTEEMNDKSQAVFSFLNNVIQKHWRKMIIIDNA